MEQATLLKIAQFRTLAARKGKTFDVVRFAGDRPFASQTLSEVLADADEELLVAGLSVMQLLGLTQPAARQSAAPAPPSTPEWAAASPSFSAPALPTAPAAAAPPPAPPRYIGRLR